MTHTRFGKGKLVTALAVAALSLSACGGGASSTTNSGSIGGEVDPAAVIRIASAGTSNNLDPQQQMTIGGWSHLTALFDRLMTVDSNDKIVPGLAKSWEFSSDGKYLELKLRDDVTFNDGTRFDAEAVAATLKRGKTLAGSTSAAALAGIIDITAPDIYTARIELAPGAGVELPGVFTTPVGMMISPAVIAAGTDLRNDPGLAGSGAYVVTKYVPGESLILKRSDRPYWDAEGGRLGGIDITLVPDASTRLNAIQTGALDLTWVSSASEVVQANTLADRGAFAIDKVPFRSTLGVYLRPTGQLADQGIRQAVAQSINPDEINALFSGNCTPHNQMFPKTSAAFDPDYKYPYAFDPEAAKALVQKNGNTKITLTFGAGSNTEKPTNVIQSALSTSGFDAELNPVPLNQLEPRYIAGEFDQMVANSFTPKVDPAETVNFYLVNNFKFAADDPEILGMIEQAADPTMSENNRAELYQKISAKTLEKALWVPICNQTNATLSSNKVVGADDVPWVNVGIYDLRHLAMTK